MMINLKDLFDAYFLQHYNVSQSKIKPIRAEYTKSEKFDLIDNDLNFVVDFGKGSGSFRNASNYQIEVLAYNSLIKLYNSGNYKLLMGNCCDYILYNDENGTIIFNEHTTSLSGEDNLEDLKDNKSGLTKFEKVEVQLENSVAKMTNVQEINKLINRCTTKVCLCSYKLYVGGNSAQRAFNRGIVLIDRETGNDGQKLSSPNIEKLGFEYIRISHNYSYKIS